MTWWQAALWGLAGGGAASLWTLTTEIVRAGYSWPWPRGDVWPYAVVRTAGLLLGAVVAMAAHSQISGPWPAFIFGIAAPVTIRGALSGVEVGPRRLPGRTPVEQAEEALPMPPQLKKREVREDVL
ncbi:hypothetical protein [Kitasatospora sp. NPDC101183]|uniref:hypothetical protein n=1 Tax=Kitasatospora sp. NPDC101183 TaxID=3364100 RepID=UPI0038096B4A